MIYYLVALLDDTFYSKVEKIQRDISDRYDLYEDLPTLHMTIEIIEDPEDLNLLCQCISSILNDFTIFTTKINGVICFAPPYKSVNLKVEKAPYILKLINRINQVLRENGFKVRENIEDWDLHISLANINFSKRIWTQEEFQEACFIASEDQYRFETKISTLQLWKPLNNKKEMIVESFSLK